MNYHVSFKYILPLFLMVGSSHCYAEKIILDCKVSGYREFMSNRILIDNSIDLTIEGSPNSFTGSSQYFLFWVCKNCSNNDIKINNFSNEGKYNFNSRESHTFYAENGAVKEEIIFTEFTLSRLTGNLNYLSYSDRRKIEISGKCQKTSKLF